MGYYTNVLFAALVAAQFFDAILVGTNPRHDVLNLTAPRRLDPVAQSERNQAQGQPASPQKIARESPPIVGTGSVDEMWRLSLDTWSQLLSVGDVGAGFVARPGLRMVALW